MHIVSDLQSPLPDDFIKPSILTVSRNILSVHPGSTFKKILYLIQEKNTVCLSGSYGFALSFYSWLKKQHNIHYPVCDYAGSRQNRDHFRLLNQHLVIEINLHQPALEKAPGNPWLKTFYPEHKNFLIRFSDFLGMNGAWQWYTNGIRFPVLNDKVHPFYGVYFPTRHEHLLLFEKWLSANHGFKRGLDIGTGCGVLALMMLKHNIQTIHATDIHPNAIYSTIREIQRRNLQYDILTEQGEFSGSFVPADTDLIVFNPPWIPGNTSSVTDLSTYFPKDYFSNFFDHLYGKVQKGTTIVMLFSTFAQVAGISDEHPIEEELQKKVRFRLIRKMQTSVRQKPSSSKNWLTKIREKENVELWELRKSS